MAYGYLPIPIRQGCLIPNSALVHRKPGGIRLSVTGMAMALMAEAAETPDGREFLDTLRVDQVARELGMSVSGLHHHFKAVTAMSPLQFQKRLRLQEARRLMLGEEMDATSAAFRCRRSVSSSSVTRPPPAHRREEPAPPA